MRMKRNKCHFMQNASMFLVRLTSLKRNTVNFRISYNSLTHEKNLVQNMAKEQSLPR